MAKLKSETFYIILQYLHIFSKTVVVPTLVSNPPFISRAPACYICSHSEGVLLCACLHWTLAKAPFTFCSCRTWISLWLVATNESQLWSKLQWRFKEEDYFSERIPSWTETLEKQQHFMTPQHLIWDRTRNHFQTYKIHDKLDQVGNVLDLFSCQGNTTHSLYGSPSSF